MKHSIIFMITMAVGCWSLGNDPANSATLTPSKAIAQTHNCSAYYPEVSRREGETGFVEVGYDVGADGALSNVHVVKSSGFPRLDDAALACVTTAWRNTPAMLDGVPVPSPSHAAVIGFSLNGAPSPNYWQSLVAQAIDQADAGQYAQATQYYNLALQLSSTSGAVYYLRGRAHFELAEYQAAAADFARAISLLCDPGDAPRYWELSNSHSDKRSADDAYGLQGASGARDVTFAPNGVFGYALMAHVPDGWRCNRQAGQLALTSPLAAQGEQQAFVIFIGGAGEYSPDQLPALALGSPDAPQPDTEDVTRISGLKAHLLRWRIEKIVASAHAFTIRSPAVSATPVSEESGEFRFVYVGLNDFKYAMLLCVVPAGTAASQIQDVDTIMASLKVLELPMSQKN